MLARWFVDAPVHVALAGLERLDNAKSYRSLAAVLLLLMLAMLLPVGWHDNEVQYLTQALKRVSPDLFSQFSAAFDPSSTRIFEEVIFGSLVSWLGYDVAHGLLRIVMAVLYGLSLAYLLNAVRLSALDAILIVALHSLLGPDLMGREWLFQGVESKTFAYACVFLALGLALHERWRPALALTILATYLHFLVGGFWALALLLLAKLSGWSWRQIFSFLAFYAVAMAPLLAMLISEQLSASTAGNLAAPSADYIYSVIRAPHHMAPFANSESTRIWAKEALNTGCLLLALLILAATTSQMVARIAWFLVLLVGYLIAAYLVSFIDRHTLFLGKFYLFRPSSLILLLVIAVVLMALRAGADRRLTLIRYMAFAFFIPLFAADLATSKAREFRETHNVYSQEELDRLNTVLASDPDRQRVVLVEPYDEYLSAHVLLHRDLVKPTLVSWKFVPTNPAAIQRWHDLVTYRARVFREGCSAPLRENVGYLLALRDQSANRLRSCGEVVFHSPHFDLIKVDPRLVENRG